MPSGGQPVRVCRQQQAILCLPRCAQRKTTQSKLCWPSTCIISLEETYRTYSHISLCFDAKFHTQKNGVGLYVRIKGKVLYYV